MSADTSQCLLEAKAVQVNYGKNAALHAMDLTLNAGDTLGLLGLNGAGKSTLLKVIAGVLAPTSGAVCIAGANLQSNAIAARQVLGYAPDKPPIYPEFTITEYLKFAAQLRRVPKKEIPSAIDAVIEKCDLGAVSKRIIGNLSHGYQQRANLAQALIHKPKLLILDEPTNGLDPAQLMEMRDLINSIHAEQATLFSSHLLTEVQATCNRVVVINDGTKLLDMPIDQLDSVHHTTYEVVLQEAAKQVDMQNIPGVVAACPVDPQRWLLTTKVNSTIISTDGIGEALLARGLQMLEVTPVRNHLERVFSQLKLNAQHPGAVVGDAA